MSPGRPGRETRCPDERGDLDPMKEKTMRVRLFLNVILVIGGLLPFLLAGCEGGLVSDCCGCECSGPCVIGEITQQGGGELDCWEMCDLGCSVSPGGSCGSAVDVWDCSDDADGSSGSNTGLGDTLP